MFLTSDSSVKDKDKSKEITAKVAKPFTNCKLEQLDQKFSEQFRRLEAMLLSKVFTQPEPVFQPVVISS